MVGTRSFREPTAVIAADPPGKGFTNVDQRDYFRQPREDVYVRTIPSLTDRGDTPPTTIVCRRQPDGIFCSESREFGPGCHVHW
jgi:hypothetical protein